MHKKALKAVGIIFGLALIIFSLYSVISFSDESIPGIDYKYRYENTKDEYVLDAYVCSEYREVKQYEFRDGEIAVDLYSAQRLSAIEESLNNLLFTLHIGGIFAGFAILLFSICIKPDKKKKAPKIVTQPAPVPTPAPQTQPAPVSDNVPQPESFGFSDIASQPAPVAFSDDATQPVPAFRQPQTQQKTFCTNCGSVMPFGNNTCLVCGYIQQQD